MFAYIFASYFTRRPIQMLMAYAILRVLEAFRASSDTKLNSQNTNSLPPSELVNYFQPF